MEENFGKELILDLYDCDLNTISSDKKIKQFSKELCEIIKMKAYGEPIVEYFGLESEKTKGYSLVQLIETSSIVAHFSEFKRSIYMNIFSCAEYDTNIALEFAMEFFEASRVVSHILERI